MIKTVLVTFHLDHCKTSSDDPIYQQAAINSSAIITSIGDVLDVCLKKSTTPSTKLPGLERQMYYVQSLERNRNWIEQGLLKQVQGEKLLHESSSTCKCMYVQKSPKNRF